MADKEKIGPKEAQVKALREARAARATRTKAEKASLDEWLKAAVAGVVEMTRKPKPKKRRRK